MSQQESYTLLISLPAGRDSFACQVSAHEQVQFMKSALQDSVETAGLTCFSFKFGDRILDPSVEIGSIPGLQDGSVLEVVLAPYTEREARLHVRRVLEFMFPMFRNSPASNLSLASQSSKLPSAPLSQVQLSLFPQIQPVTVPKCVRYLAHSLFNPPPPHRKIAGDLFYLDVVTLEGTTLCITASVGGFYVNKSKPNANQFDPNPASPAYAHHDLIDLLKAASPQCRTNFPAALETLSHRNPMAVATSVVSPAPQWIGRAEPHQADPLRASRFAVLGVDEPATLASSRDWTEELDLASELPSDTLENRLMRDQAMHRVLSDFNEAATQAAVALVEGILVPLNPSEPPESHIYMHNNILLMVCTDDRDELVQPLSVEEIVGRLSSTDHPTHKQAALELLGVRTISSILRTHHSVKGLYGLPMTLVDYRGFRVLTQSIVPGFMSAEPTELAYGAMDGNKPFRTDAAVEAKLRPLAQALHLAPHDIIDAGEQRVTAVLPADCKAMRGSDGRLYLFDLTTVSPRDANFPNAHTALLRPELVSSFSLTRALRTVKESMAKEQREAAAAAAATPLSEVASAVAEAAAVPAAPVTAAAAAAAGAATATAADEPGSAGDAAAAAAAEGGKEPEPGQRAAEQDRKRIEESLAAAASWAELNADLLQPHVRHAGDTGAAMKLLEDLAQYLMESVVPRLATELASVDVPVWETNTLRDAFRARGVNMRYAGKVAQLVPAPASVRPVLLQEMVARTARRILRPLLRATAAPHLSAVLATFLNALCGTPKSKGEAAATVTPVIVAENEVVEGLLSQLGVPASAYPVVASKDPVSVPTGAALWAQIVEQTKLHFGYELTAADLAIVRTPALLRTFALRVGIKLRARDYSFAVPTPFTAADILAVQPITKTTLFNSADGAARLQRGRELLRQMHVMEALAVLQSAIHCFGQVTGPVHPAAAATYQTLSSLCMMVGDLIGALDCQQRALLLLEHSSGLDHPEVIQGYTLLASLCAHFTDAHDAAVAYMQRAIYLAAVHTGPNSVAVAQYYIHMASILEEPMPEQAVSYLLAAIRILEQVLGPRHQRVAFQHRNVAMVYALMKKWREATEHMTLFKDVFGELFGPASAPVREAEEALAEIKAQSDPLHIRTSARRQKGPRLTVMEETATNTLPLEDVLSFVNGDAPAPVRAYTAQLAASAQQRTGAVPSGDAPKVDVPEVPMPPAATAATAAATVKGKKRRSAPADAAASAASASASAAAAAPSE